MTKYTDRLEAWLQTSTATSSKKQRNKNHIEYLSVKKDVQEAFNEGFKMRTIWEHLSSEKRITMAYSTFTRRVRTDLGRAIKNTVSTPEKKGDKVQSGQSPRPKKGNVTADSFKFTTEDKGFI